MWSSAMTLDWICFIHSNDTVSLLSILKDIPLRYARWSVCAGQVTDWIWVALDKGRHVCVHNIVRTTPLGIHPTIYDMNQHLQVLNAFTSTFFRVVFNIDFIMPFPKLRAEIPTHFNYVVGVSALAKIYWCITAYLYVKYANITVGPFVRAEISIFRGRSGVALVTPPLAPAVPRN